MLDGGERAPPGGSAPCSLISPPCSRRCGAAVEVSAAAFVAELADTVRASEAVVVSAAVFVGDPAAPGFVTAIVVFTAIVAALVAAAADPAVVLADSAKIPAVPAANATLISAAAAADPAEEMSAASCHRRWRHCRSRPGPPRSSVRPSKPPAASSCCKSLPSGKSRRWDGKPSRYWCCGGQAIGQPVPPHHPRPSPPFLPHPPPAGQALPDYCPTYPI